MRRRLILAGVLFAATLAGCGSSSGTPTGGAGGTRGGSGPVVETTFGPVEGFEDAGVFSYRGIPYAAPPVGDLRWKPPTHPAAWTETLAATETPSPCPQDTFGGLPVPGFAPSEDCLYLNLDTPTEGSDLPVMVWIHGGGFTLGEGVQTDGGTVGDRIARETGTIVVSMNYRLGQLGFLAHSTLSEESPDGASGNYGLMDQTAALRWVQENIAHFGGDPDNVTIFGESAGAFSACGHLASPKSAGLFAKAILQSGSCERPWGTLAAGEAQGDVFAEVLGCASDDDVLACMRGKSADEVVAALPPGPNFGFNPGGGPSGSWWPVLDGSFFTEQPADSFASGNFNQVPAIVGFTQDEARLFTWLGEIADPPLEVTADNYLELIARFVGDDPDLAARAAAEYPLEDYSEPPVALAAVVTDTAFRCPGKTEVAKLAAFVPAYLYQFEYQNGRSQLEAALPFLGADPPSYDLGAFHGVDISYVFGYSPILQFDLEDFSTSVVPWSEGSTDETLWLETLGYFTRFAATGNPNLEGGVAWPLYDEEADEHLAFDEVVSVRSKAAAGKCEFWAGEDYLRAELSID